MYFTDDSLLPDEDRDVLSGELPSPLNPPTGCHFHPRCPLAGPRCAIEAPKLTVAGHGGAVACHLNDGGVA